MPQASLPIKVWKIPYLQKRGDGFSFHISYPDEFQTTAGKREFTKTLETGDKSVAIPRRLAG
ncbi:MAG: hypothetical protein ABS69_14845 [Nitrosomonadales bacterium SCN 54-20]|nr:hypothetical protein [Nitrosospira multiformis]ODT71570.1 MAG: hypothetical protein ABS69_14845 [Nitrosomonadales bacterium SCN 54-20]